MAKQGMRLLVVFNTSFMFHGMHVNFCVFFLVRSASAGMVVFNFKDLDNTVKKTQGGLVSVLSVIPCNSLFMFL